MSLALELAKRGLYTTSPNPRVGCVIVQNGNIIGQAWHERAGEPHAEVLALRAAQSAGADTQGSTVYVTLEPCSHTGRTPPCVDALIAAGVVRVAMAMQDPNPLVSGSGLACLRAAGIQVALGLFEEEAKELNIGFVSRMQRGRPWVRLKIAASLDGKTALLNGKSQWITGSEARRDGHAWRARACAVLTGIGTVLMDDPQLSVREVETSRQPLRIVLDSKLRIPLSAKILEGGNTLIVASQENAEKCAALRTLGVDVIILPDENGKISLVALLEELGRREMNEVHVEAGSTLNGALLQAGLVDECVLYFAPVFLGEAARGMFNLPALTCLDDKKRFDIVDVRTMGEDIRFVIQPIRDCP